MKKLILLLSFSLALLASRAGAQIVLDDFTTGTQPGEGAALGTGSWVGQVTQNATTITVGGTAHDDNGWGVFNLPAFDASALHSIVITAQLDAGNAAPSFNVQFFDDVFGGQAFSISTSAFVTGVMTTVTIPLGPWVSADPTQLSAWTIGGGNSATNGPFLHMTFDQLALTPSAVPEPATSAALAGVLVLGITLWHRRRLPRRGLSLGKARGVQKLESM
jgi:hypothetical protein